MCVWCIILQDFGQPSSSADDLQPATSDANEATMYVQPPQLTSSDISSLVSTVTVLPSLFVSEHLQSAAAVTGECCDHTYHHHSSRRKPLDDAAAQSVAAARYLERRHKNNAASKRSREVRKRQLLSMEDEVVQLELRNVQLRQRVAELERATELMRSTVVNALRQAS